MDISWISRVVVMKKIKMLFYIILCLTVVTGCGRKETAKKEMVTTEVEMVKTTKEIVTEQNTTKWEEEDVMETEEEVAVEETITEETTAEKGILIALDPGHQSSSVDMSATEPNAPGSSEMKRKATGGTQGQYSGVPEYQLNLDIALMVKEALMEQGYDVVMTRNDNETAISNAERATLANEAGADISVRIHANGSEDSSVNGALVLIGSQNNSYVGNLYDESYLLGETLLNSYCEITGMKNLGIQTNDTMTGINWSEIPVVILEMGFMSNQQDDLNMADETYRQKMVEGIVKGINKYYGYETKE